MIDSHCHLAGTEFAADIAITGLARAHTDGEEP